MPAARTHTATGRIEINPALGTIRRLEFVHGGRTLAPLHTAPWVDDPDATFGPETPPVERQLSGDFFCAPFGASDLIESPPHGWSANSAWTPLESPAGALRFRLEREIMGARLTKTLTLAPDAPILYQSHLIEGGSGALTVAHHPMIRLAGRGTLSLSPKRAALTPSAALEPGRNRLATGQRFTDLHRCPAADGGTLDLTSLPIGDRHEDFVTLIEAEGSALGWSVVIREEEDDLIFIVKNPRTLPVTMLWHSNAGRDYAPWNSRHTGVLGIEDGRAAGADGHRAATGPNPVAAEGVPTAFTLGPRHRIGHALGAIRRPAGWTRVATVVATEGRLTLTEAGGQSVSLPFDTDFLQEDR